MCVCCVCKDTPGAPGELDTPPPSPGSSAKAFRHMKAIHRPGAGYLSQRNVTPRFIFSLYFPSSFGCKVQVIELNLPSLYAPISRGIRDPAPTPGSPVGHCVFALVSFTLFLWGWGGGVLCFCFALDAGQKKQLICNQ